MTIATIRTKQPNELLAEEIYTRWRLEANYALSPLHSEWVIRWLALALSALIEREAKTIAEKSGAMQLQSRIDLLLTAAERLEDKLKVSQQDVREARAERDRERANRYSRDRAEGNMKPDNYAKRLVELKYVMESNSKLTNKLSDAQSVIDSLREENQRMSRELCSVQEYLADSKRYAEEMVERTHLDIIPSVLP